MEEPQKFTLWQTFTRNVETKKLKLFKLFTVITARFIMKNLIMSFGYFRPKKTHI